MKTYIVLNCLLLQLVLQLVDDVVEFDGAVLLSLLQLRLDGIQLVSKVQHLDLVRFVHLPGAVNAGFLKLFLLLLRFLQVASQLQKGSVIKLLGKI